MVKLRAYVAVAMLPLLLISLVLVVLSLYVGVLSHKQPTSPAWQALAYGSVVFFVSALWLLVWIWDPSKSYLASNGRHDRSLRRLGEWTARARFNRLEVIFIIGLLILTGVALTVSYSACYAVFASVQEQKFGPSETAQVITAVSGLGLAIGTGIASIIKAYALLLRARADFVRAKSDLPPNEQISRAADRQLGPPE